MLSPQAQMMHCHCRRYCTVRSPLDPPGRRDRIYTVHLNVSPLLELIICFARSCCAVLSLKKWNRKYIQHQFCPKKMDGTVKQSLKLSQFDVWQSSACSEGEVALQDLSDRRFFFSRCFWLCTLLVPEKWFSWKEHSSVLVGRKLLTGFPKDAGLWVFSHVLQW